jgi:hypothetical protein
MSAGVLHSLNSDNIIRSQTDHMRGMDDHDYTPYELKGLAKDNIFYQIFEDIFTGGLPPECHLELKCQVAEKSGRLIYNGKRYTRGLRWRPPKVIWMMGRLAKELPNPYNNNPEISIETQSGEVLRLDACPCGGELLLDHRQVLYCAKCFKIYE